MSKKNLDRCGRARCVTVAFRVSPEEAAQLDALVALSGLTKQDYITSRLLERSVIVKPNIRFQKAVRAKMGEMLYELRRLEDASGAGQELREIAMVLVRTLEGLGSPEGCGKDAPSDAALIGELRRE